MLQYYSTNNNKTVLNFGLTAETSHSDATIERFNYKLKKYIDMKLNFSRLQSSVITSNYLIILISIVTV